MIFTPSFAATREQRDWGNGAGTFGDVLCVPLHKAFPAMATPDASAFRLRISIATILRRESLFSHFEGLMRRHLLTEGETLLSVESTELPLTGRFPQCCFSGGAKTTCRLISDTACAFNIIFDSTVETSEIEIVPFPFELHSPAPASSVRADHSTLERLLDVFFVAEGQATFASSSGSMVLGKHDAVILERHPGEPLPRGEFDGSGTLLVARLALRREPAR